MSLTEQILALLRADGDALIFDDNGVNRLIALVRPLDGDELVQAARDLFRLAHFLDVERKSPAASATLLTLVLELAPALHALDAAAAAALVSGAEAAAARLRNFTGDERVAKVLDTGARPAGTTPAGPLARFTIAKK